MTTIREEHVEWIIEGRTWWFDEEAVEHSLLLPGRQTAELESLAHHQGITTGQLIRLLISEYLRKQSECGKEKTMSARTAKVSKATTAKPTEKEAGPSSSLMPVHQHPSWEEIRLHAYQNWEAAGKPSGDGVNFWLAAEQALLEKK